MAPQVGHLLHLALVATALLFLCSSYFATPAFAMSSQPPADLVIETIYLPANAASLPKTRTDDRIAVHYVRPRKSNPVNPVAIGVANGDELTSACPDRNTLRHWGTVRYLYESREAFRCPARDWSSYQGLGRRPRWHGQG